MICKNRVVGSRKCVAEQIYVRIKPPFDTKDFVTRVQLASKHGTRFCRYILCSVAFSGMLWNTVEELQAAEHYDDVIMSEIASQITSLTIVYSTVHLGADQSKHQSSASLAFVWEIHRWPVNFPHKWPVTRKKFPFDDVIMVSEYLYRVYQLTSIYGSRSSNFLFKNVINPSLLPLVSGYTHIVHR